MSYPRYPRYPRHPPPLHMYTRYIPQDFDNGDWRIYPLAWQTGERLLEKNYQITSCIFFLLSNFLIPQLSRGHEKVSNSKVTYMYTKFYY